MLLIFGLLIFVVAGIIIIATQFLPTLTGRSQPAATPTPSLTMVNVVLVAQDISVGSIISDDKLVVGPWPSTYDLEGLVKDKASIIGRRAKTDLRRGEPIFSSQVAEAGTAVSYTASAMSLKIDPGKVAIALPIDRLSSVAYGINAGDHVMVIATLMFIDIDPGLQTELTNSILLVDKNNEGNIVFQEVKDGRLFEEAPLSDNFLATYYVPTEAQRARMTSIILVQNAMVLNVGNVKASTSSSQQSSQTKTTATPVPVKTNPDIMIVQVSPEEALALNFTIRIRGNITYAIRSAGDTAVFNIPSLDLKRMMEDFKIDLPAKLSYGTNPRVDTPYIPVLGNDIAVEAK
jgi:pilus assembly protein CpaB